RDAFESLRFDSEDLHRLGADASEFDAAMQDLERALASNDLAETKGLVVRCRHAAEAARELHYRGIMERTLSVILANATRGLDPDIANGLLKEVDDAITVGRQIDVQSLIDDRMSAIDAETASRLNARILAARDFVVELKAAGQETVAMEGKLADAMIALQERRYAHADALLDAS
ncbi:MAG: hypothetical protein ACT4OI_00155, partial [Methanobacteriota archaeon]